MLILTIETVWRSMFHVARRVCFVQRGAVRDMTTSVSEGWGGGGGRGELIGADIFFVGTLVGGD